VTGGGRDVKEGGTHGPDTRGAWLDGRGADELMRIVLRAVLDRTSRIDAVDVGPWLPSILVRRRGHLELAAR
jgi:hypothetical protein